MSTKDVGPIKDKGKKIAEGERSGESGYDYARSQYQQRSDSPPQAPDFQPPRDRDHAKNFLNFLRCRGCFGKGQLENVQDETELHALPHHNLPGIPELDESQYDYTHQWVQMQTLDQRLED